MKHPFLAPTLAAAACAAAHAQVTLTDYGAPDALSFEARGVSGDGSKLLGFLYLNNCFLCTRAFTMDAPNHFTFFDATTGRPDQHSAEPKAISRDGAVLAGLYGPDYSHIDRSPAGAHLPPPPRETDPDLPARRGAVPDRAIDGPRRPVHPRR